MESLRLIDGQEQRGRRYYISNIGKFDARHMLDCTRGHWGVEQRLHWCLDVSFDEDRRRIRKDHGAENFSELSRISLNFLKQGRTEKVGIKSKRLRCGWDHDYLLKVLTQGDYDAIVLPRTPTNIATSWGAKASKTVRDCAMK